MNEVLPQSVVDEDHKLEKSAESASEKLAGLRWHWTLDETNPDRVSLRQYARQVGLSDTLIRKYAHGYQEWRANDIVRSLSETMERSAMGAERQAVTEAVADARGLSFNTVRLNRPTEVRRVREMAREAAERKGTDVGDEARRIAQFAAKVEARDVEIRDARASRRTLRYVELEGHLLAALRNLSKAVQTAAVVDWDAEEQELLKDTINQVRQMLTLVDGRIAGTEAIDWDVELAAIMEKVS